MKTLLFSLFVPVVFLFSGSTKPIDKEHCSCENIPLYGKVRVVKNFGDFKIRETTIGEDLRVQVVTIGPSKCGQWEFVTFGEDFTVEYVTIGEDFTVRFVTIGPGL